MTEGYDNPAIFSMSNLVVQPITDPIHFWLIVCIIVRSERHVTPFIYHTQKIFLLNWHGSNDPFFKKSKIAYDLVRDRQTDRQDTFDFWQIYVLEQLWMMYRVLRWSKKEFEFSTVHFKASNYPRPQLYAAFLKYLLNRTKKNLIFIAGLVYIQLQAVPPVLSLCDINIF